MKMKSGITVNVDYNRFIPNREEKKNYEYRQIKFSRSQENYYPYVLSEYNLFRPDGMIHVCR